jgi:integrase
MARPRNQFPKPRCHKGAAVLDTYDGDKRRTVTLGPWGSEQASIEYERVLTRLRADKSAAPPPLGSAPTSVAADLTVAEALVRYTEYIDRYYVNPDGTPTGTADDIKITLGYIRRLFAHLFLREFDVRCFKAVRQALVDDGRVRNQVNRRAGMVRSFIRWCVAEELPVAIGVLERLRAVRALASGRDGVPEGEPRAPADPATVEKVLPLLSKPVAAIIGLLRLTGARPSEILNLKPCEIDRTGDMWTLTPTRHKGSWRGKARVIYLGPAARTLLTPWLLKTPGPDAYVFSPARFTAEKNAERSANRKTKRWPSHMKRNQRKRKGAIGKRQPRDHYSHLAVSCAVRRACKKAKVTPFTPYELRHLRASEIREQYSLEHVRAVLGHSFAGMSDHYSKAADKALAAKVSAEAG